MSLLSSLFKGKKGTTITQEAMQTDEQKDAMKMLSDFSKTGKFGDYRADEGYTGKLGEYGQTGLEQAGQNKIMSMLSGGSPEIFEAGKGTILDLLTSDKFDPYSENGIYSGFKKQTLREADEASDRLKRNMAITGDLFSTAQGKEQGLLQERTHGTLTDKLAQLYDTFAQRKLAGAQTAANMGIAERGMESDAARMSQQFGQLERMLKDAEAKDKYSEWMRKRQSQQQTIDAAKALFNKDVPYGVKSYTTADSASPFSKILNAGLGAAGTAFGAPIGSMIGGSISSLFSPKLKPLKGVGIGGGGGFNMMGK